MKTLICVPCYDMMESGFVECLYKMRKVGQVDLEILAGSLIYDARNRLADKAVKGNYDYILWLDSDLIFAEDALIDLFEAIKGKDFVSGVYYRRKPNHQPCLYKTLRMGLDGPTSEDFDEIPEGEFEIEGCGFGMVLMKTEIIKAIGAGAFSPINGFGEDLSFCLKARRAGYQLFGTSKVKCGHIGKTIIDENAYKAFKAYKER